MLGQAGFMTGIKEDVMEPMIDLVKNVEPGYGSIFAISEVEAATCGNCVNRSIRNRLDL